MYITPKIEVYEIDSCIVCGSKPGNNGHEGWLNENGEPWQPGDGKPIKPNHAA